MITRKLCQLGEDGLIVYGYSIRPARKATCHLVELVYRWRISGKGKKVAPQTGAVHLSW
jgi:hypothetical protein